jgi:acetyl esterase/lipase
MIPRIIAAVIGLAFCTAAMAHEREDKKPGADSFDMPAYLAALSAEGKERGYQEFVYKQTPQGELRIYFAMPAKWSPTDERPALIFFFGGGWSGGHVFACAREAEFFSKRGVVVGLADYRVRKRQGVTPDKCAEDARSAVRWARANCKTLGIDPNRVIAGGGSAGGHIAACMAIPDGPNSGTDDLRVSCIPNGLLLYYPVASLVDGSRAGAFQRLLGEDLALKLSPARHVSKSWPATVIFSGTADIELANAVLMYENATQAEVTLELYLAEGRGHGVVNTAPRDFGWLQVADGFFTRAGLIEPSGTFENPPPPLIKYNGEPLEKIAVKSVGDAPRPKRKRGAETKSDDASSQSPPESPPRNP